MKLLFLADIHIKERYKNVPFEWAENRWQLFLTKLQNIQKQADYLVFGGDIFDTALPTPIETRRYFELIQACILPTVIIPGNHEQKTKKYNILSDYANSTNSINTLVSVITEPRTINGIDYLPYQYLDKPTNSSNILITHVRGAIPPHVKPEVDLSIYNKYKVVLAGDLHGRSNSQLNILYPGSPFTTSTHRKISKGENGAIILDTESLTYEFVDLELPQLIKKTITSVDDIVDDPYHHIIWELEGDMTEVSKIKSSEKIVKKPKVRESVASINLTGSITDELKTYLLEVLNIKSSYDLERIISRHADYTTTQS